MILIWEFIFTNIGRARPLPTAKVQPVKLACRNQTESLIMFFICSNSFRWTIDSETWHWKRWSRSVRKADWVLPNEPEHSLLHWLISFRSVTVTDGDMTSSGKWLLVHLIHIPAGHGSTLSQDRSRESTTLWG